MKDHPIVDYYPDYSGALSPSIACRFFSGKFVELDRAERLIIFVTNGTEQDDKDLRSMTEELYTKLFPKVLTFVSE